MSNPGNLYPVMELETMYSDLLKSDNIHHNNHSNTFTDLLVKYVPGLNKKTANKRVSASDTAAIALNTSSETYFESLVRAIGPAMHRNCQEHPSLLNVDLQSQFDSVPIELVQLINILRDGIDLNDKGYSTEALAISQTQLQIQHKK